MLSPENTTANMLCSEYMDHIFLAGAPQQDKEGRGIKVTQTLVAGVELGKAPAWQLQWPGLDPSTEIFLNVAR